MIDKVAPGKSYIAFNLKCLTYLGTWNPWNDRRRWVYNVYTFVMLFVMASRINGYIITARALQHNFLQQTLMLVVISTFSVGLLKHINTLWHHSNVLFLARLLAWERSTICSTQVALYRDEVLRKTMKFTKNVTLIWLCLGTFDLPLFYRECLDENHRTINHLPISYTVLRNLLEPLNFLVILLIDFLTFLIYCCSIISNDCLFLALMLHIAAQFKILNFRLKTCTAVDDDYQIGDEFDTNSIGTKGPKHSAPYSSPNHQLIICIQHYQKIFGMMRVLRKIYGLILLPQLISSTSLITFVGIHVFVTKTVNLGDPSSAGVVLLTLFSALIQLGVYCLAGNSIIVASDLTTSAAYNCQWYREDSTFKTKMTIFLSMSKKPMSVSAIGLFELSCITLKNVLTKSYSAMALLQKSAE
ncbi:uncharacterized protein [Fopius arisanus]|uniref:Odorant receptor n=1 Tax=Fopius arisanus TaxID=64838 RepID=A0A9R1TJF8_9HYME|nr:PREDICTED: uncharacterized protein LOC105270852 isoform X1 [Fopius arisanus]